MTSIQSNRKDEHLFLAEKFFEPHAEAGFSEVRLIHQPLPELTVEEVDVRPNLFDWQWPFFINAMTGGSKQTGRINAQLAEIARDTGLAMAVGSASIAIKEPDLAHTFAVARETNPGGFIFANIGGNQPIEAAREAVKIIQADALQVHLNSIQELVMPEGDSDLHFLDTLAAMRTRLDVPLVVKAVGAGMTHEAAAALERVGIDLIDVGGRGGTSFARIENARRRDFGVETLTELGQSTVESLLETRAFGGRRIATGGIRTPLDIVKALALGADAVGVAGLMLHWLLQDGVEETKTHIRHWQSELKLLYAALGVRNTSELQQTKPLLSTELSHYLSQRLG